MKSSIAIGVILFLFFLLIPITTVSQNIEVFNLIDKPINSVINKYGKPVHQDRTNPTMECVFYKTKTCQLVFVANKKGVYQAEANKNYKTKKSAIKELDKIISSSIKHGFVSDTLSITEFSLKKGSTKAEVSLYESVGSHKYKIQVKAHTP